MAQGHGKLHKIHNGFLARRQEYTLKPLIASKDKFKIKRMARGHGQLNKICNGFLVRKQD